MDNPPGNAKRCSVNIYYFPRTGKYKTHWRGLVFLKDPFSIVTYQQLLWDVKPQTIIEFGANSGGSAVWMADVMKIYGFQTHVFSMDIDLDLLEPLAREKRDDITFIQGDSNEPGKSFPPELLKVRFVNGIKLINN